jgi:small subunit ribosomal protein S6
MAKLSANYEVMIVISLSKGEEAAQAIWAKFKEMIEKQAELGEVEEWGKRKLAYPINYETDAYYVVAGFTSAPEFPAELDRVMNITDGVLRSMITAKE